MAVIIVANALNLFRIYSPFFVAHLNQLLRLHPSHNRKELNNHQNHIFKQQKQDSIWGSKWDRHQGETYKMW